MILYCFKCHDCNYTWEGWCTVGDSAGQCPDCESTNTGRNYQAENKAVVPDIKPGFNQSIGMNFSGRRDLLSKMKGAGFTSVADSGGIHTTTGLQKRHYGEEQYREEVQHVGAGGFDNWYNEQLDKGIRESNIQDDGTGYPDGALRGREVKPEMMKKRRVQGHGVLEGHI